ncbi:MAG: arginase family protein [Anaerolineales bacterium]|jgi:arginase
MIRNRVILTPYFLDEAEPELEDLAGPDWYMNKPELPPGDRMLRISTLHQGIADFTESSLLAGERPVSYAGDCCAVIGVQAGLVRAGLETTLLWLDAHGDFNTWETTPSGFLGGMPLAMLVGRGEQTLLEALDIQPLAEERVILTDARDLDPGEDKAVAESGVLHLRNPLELLKRELPEGQLYVHFDVDIINPDEAPAVSYPASGGPSADELDRIFGRLVKSEQVAAASISSWNPELDGDLETQRLCLRLFNRLIGD